MEYTRDLFFNLNCDVAKKRKNTLENNWTSILYKKIKKHKVISITLLSASLLVILDSILILNFINILGNL